MNLRFRLEAANTWQLGAGGFSLALTSVAFETRIYPMAGSTVALSHFAADALLGDKVRLRATGTYPDGEVSLGLVPGAAVPVRDLVQALGLTLDELDNLIPGDLLLTELVGSYDFGRRDKSFSVALEQRAVRPSGSDATLHGFELKNIRLDIHGAAAYVFKLSAAFSYTFETANSQGQQTLDFAGAAVYDEGWLLRFSYRGHVTLQQLGSAFGFRELPDELNNFAFEELSFSIDTATGHKYFHGKAATHFLATDGTLELSVHHGPAATDFFGTFATSGGKPAVFSLSYTKNNGGYELDIKLLFTIAGVDIYLNAQSQTAAPTDADGEPAGKQAADKQLSEKHFVGGTKGLKLPIFKLVNGLMHYAGMHIPDEFNPDIKLKDIYVSYNGATQRTDLVALGAVVGQEVQLFFQYDGKAKQYAFGIDTSIDFDKTLSQLPLVGSQLQGLTLSGIGFVYVSGEGKFTLPSLSKAESDGAIRTIDLTALAEKTYKAGVNFTGEVGLPFLDQPLTLALPIGGQEAPPPADKETPGVPAPAPAALEQKALPKPTMLTTTAEEGTKWFELDRKIGPLQLKKFGLDYAHDKLYVLISLELSMAGVGITLEGLGLGFDPRKLLTGTFDAEFKLAGLGLFYSKPGLTIEGAILRKELTAKEKETVRFQFDGALIVQAETWGLAAVASYAQMEKGTVSLFIFVDVTAALGGPPFFFVEGLMGGFGINRALRLPTFEQVHDFPLLAIGKGTGSVQDQAMATLDKLENGATPWITTSEGDYWLAVGVKFSSFKVVRGELLLIAAFGHELKFTVLGLARLVLPLPPEGEAASLTPFVFLELQMAAVLEPAQGYFSVAASLTADSYVLTKDCHITGGFAYSMWYGNSPHAGDFVLTAGGYQPAFAVPDHYPRVARMGYNWHVSDNVSIRGESYFAVTPACGMAGTSLEVVFEAGDLKVWFIAKADMLVTWHPLSFTAEVYVELGASIRLNLLFCHKTISVSLSAALSLWGPPLGGTVRVHVVVVDVSVSFGDQGGRGRNYEELEWTDFEHLLPARNDVCTITANSGLTQTLKADNQPDITANGGLTQTPQQESQPDVWVVRAGTFSFTAQSAIPVSRLTYGQNEHLDIPNTGINIRPMFAANVTSDFTLKLTKDGSDADIYGVAEEWEVTAAGGHVALVTGSLAPALWGDLLTEDGRLIQAPARPSNEVLASRPIGCFVQAPGVKAGATFGLIALAELQYEEVAEGSNLLRPAPLPALPNYQRVATEDMPDPLTQAKARQARRLGPAAPLQGVSAPRSCLLGALTAAGLLAPPDAGPPPDPAGSTTLTELATHYTSLFAEAPMLLA